MYLTLYMVILIATIILTKIKHGTIIKSNILFTGMWCICAGLSSLGLYDLYKPSIFVHLYSITTIVFFNIVFFVYNKKSSISINFSEINGFARLKTIYILNLICWIYLSKFLPRAIDIIASGGLKALRPYAFDSSLGMGTSLELTISQWIIGPVLQVTILIAMVYMVIERKSPVLKLIALINVILHTVIFGGRYIIVKMMMYYIFSFLIVKANILKDLKKKKINVLFIGVVIIGIIVITSQREWGNTTLIESTIIYYVGSFSFLNFIIENPYMFNLTSTPLLGMSMFGFVINIIVLIFSLLFRLPYKGSDYLITQMTATPRPISPTQYYNGMPTMLYPFLRDLGYVGIIIGTVFLAWFISYAEKKFKKDRQLIYLCLYVYLCFVLFDSVMSYQLLFTAEGVSLSLLFLFMNFKDYKTIDKRRKIIIKR